MEHQVSEGNTLTFPVQYEKFYTETEITAILDSEPRQYGASCQRLEKICFTVIREW
jgi:hypothetical protein